MTNKHCCLTIGIYLASSLFVLINVVLSNKYLEKTNNELLLNNRYKKDIDYNSWIDKDTIMLNFKGNKLFQINKYSDIKFLKSYCYFGDNNKYTMVDKITDDFISFDYVYVYKEDSDEYIKTLIKYLNDFKIHPCVYKKWKSLSNYETIILHIKYNTKEEKNQNTDYNNTITFKNLNVKYL